MHRESQLIGSRDDLGYLSLRDYRRAATERLSFSDSLDQTADMFFVHASAEGAEESRLEALEQEAEEGQNYGAITQFSGGVPVTPLAP